MASVEIWIGDVQIWTKNFWSLNLSTLISSFMISTQVLSAINWLFGAILETQPPETPPGKDPLIAHGLEVWQYIGIAILGVTAIATVGFFSRRVEYAIFFAIGLSIVLIVFFLTV